MESVPSPSPTGSATRGPNRIARSPPHLNLGYSYPSDIPRRHPSGIHQVSIRPHPAAVAVFFQRGPSRACVCGIETARTNFFLPSSAKEAWPGPAESYADLRRRGRATIRHYCTLDCDGRRDGGGVSHRRFRASSAPIFSLGWWWGGVARGEGRGDRDIVGGRREGGSAS